MILTKFGSISRNLGDIFKSRGLENIAKILENRAEFAQNHDARNAVSPRVSVLKWSGAIFHPRSSKISLQKVLLCSFHCKPRPSGLSLGSSGLEIIVQVRRNRAEVCQNHDARNAVSTTLSVLKLSRAIFWSRSSKVSVQKVLLCPFYCRPRTSGVSLESQGLENIPQSPGNLIEVGQNHDSRTMFSASLSVLKWSGAIFRPRSSKLSV